MRSFSRVHHAQPDIMAKYHSEFIDRVPSTYITFAIQGCHPELVITPRFLKCIFVLSSEFPEYVGWTYNMSHERVSTLFPPPVRYPASPFFKTACPSRARVSRSLCLVRQVSRASSCSTKCSLADPNSPFLPLRSSEIIMICLPN